MKEKNKKKLVCVDIDMVVADNRKRLMRCIDARGTIQYKKFFSPALLATDTPIRGAKKALTLIRTHYKILYITSRPASTRFATLKWLRKHGLLEKKDKLRFTGTYEKKIPILRRYKKELFLFIDDSKYDYQSSTPKLNKSFLALLTKNDIPYTAFTSWGDVMSRYFRRPKKARTQTHLLQGQ